MPREQWYTIRACYVAPDPPKPPSPEPAEQKGAAIMPAALGPEELAQYLGCSRSYVYQLMDRGELRWFRLGKLRKVLRSDADEFLRRLCDEAEGAR